MAAVLLFTLLIKASAEVDPNFYIYLCFGQSNMEGNAPAESVDKVDVDKRLQLLATCNYDNPKRTMGQWYTAVPPLVNPIGGLGPTDYFGRTMVAALPANVRVGVIPVAMGGSPIEMFDKDKYAQKMAEKPGEWWAQIARNNYGGNPYKRLVDMGKKAQQVGVIKGILLHQGCSNCGDPNWPNMVKKIYNDLLNDLGLGADSVPLFAGETLRQENGGGCYGHNVVVAKLPSVIPTAHVISSEGLPGNGKDAYHFSAMGYRLLGERYAAEALRLMGLPLKADADYKMGSTLKKFYTVGSLDIVSNLALMPGSRQSLTATAVYEDGHREEVTNDVTYSSDDITIQGNVIQATKEGNATVVASYIDFLGNKPTKTINVSVRLFSFSKDCFTRIAGTLKYNEATRTVNLTAGGQIGWKYVNGVDMSDYKYLILKLKEPQSCAAQLRIFNKNNVHSACYKDTINDRTTVVVPLHNMVYNAAGDMIDPKNVCIVELRFGEAGTLTIDDVFLTNDEQYNPVGIETVQHQLSAGGGPAFDLQGRPLGKYPKSGIYIRNGKKIRARHF